MIRTRWLVVVFGVLLAGLVLLLTELPAIGAEKSANENWAQWRGPSGQGYCDDKTVPLQWSEKENLLWKTRLPGAGNSTPIVWGDRIFLTASSDKGTERSVLCVSGLDGKVLWQHTPASKLGTERTHPWNGHASASCTTDGTQVYAFLGSPGLFCYDFEGKLIWKHVFGTFVSRTGWGSAASPFLFEDLVIQNCDNDGAKAPTGDSKLAPMALVAFDKKTGAIRWSTPRNQGQGWSTPRLIPVQDGRIDLVLNGPHGVWGYDPRTGKELWRCTRTDPGDQHWFGEPMPVNDGQTMFVLSGRTGPCQAIGLPGKGDVTKTLVRWQKPRGHRDVASPLLLDGRVYVSDRGAILTCFELATGKELYTQQLGPRGSSKSLASPVLVHNRILWLLDNGITIVQEPGPVFKEVGRNKLGDGSSLEFGASPAIVAGRLYLRSQTHLYCIGEK